MSCPKFASLAYASGYECRLSPSELHIKIPQAHGADNHPPIVNERTEPLAVSTR